MKSTNILFPIKEHKEEYYYHGTVLKRAKMIKERGLKPSMSTFDVFKKFDKNKTTSDLTDPRYVYLFKDKKDAALYAKVLAENYPNKKEYHPTVVKIKTGLRRLEPDRKAPLKGAYKFMGEIYSKDIKGIEDTK